MRLDLAIVLCEKYQRIRTRPVETRLRHELPGSPAHAWYIQQQREFGRPAWVRRVHPGAFRQRSATRRTTTSVYLLPCGLGTVGRPRRCALSKRLGRRSIGPITDNNNNNNRIIISRRTSIITAEDQTNTEKKYVTECKSAWSPRWRESFGRPFVVCRSSSSGFVVLTSFESFRTKLGCEVKPSQVRSV